MEDEPIVIDRTLTIDQVAKILGVHRGTIYRIAGQKGFPTGVKIGGRRRFFLSSLQAYIEKLKAKGG
jgi:excisionase family DNA binding protein